MGAFAVKMSGGDNSRYYKGAIPNQYVYDVLEAAGSDIYFRITLDFKEVSK